MATREELIRGLNDDLASEWGSVIRYVYQASKATGLHGFDLRNLFEGIVQEELEHAIFLANVIVDLGGDPATTPQEFSKTEDLRSMIELNLGLEAQDVSNLMERARQAAELGKMELKVRLEEMAAEEDAHARELRRLIKGL